MKYSSRFFLYAPLAVFLILCVAASVTWWIKASALSDRLAAVNGREVMPGVTLAFAAKKIGGFPFNLDTEIRDFSVAVATPNGPTRWTAERFALHALTYGRDETIFEAAGRQRLEWTKEDGTRRTLDFAVGALRASAIVRSGSLSRFDLDLVGFGSKAFTAQRLQFHARQDAKATQLFVTADGLTNCRHSTIRYSATVTIDKAFERLQLAEQSWSEAVASWRTAGGNTIPDKKTPLADLAAEHVLDASAIAAAVCGR
jgi:hypothetical protein